MSDYTQTTDFGVKDTYSHLDPRKVVKGTELNVEFNAIEGAGITKEDKASKGAASGYASLDSSSLVPLAQVPPKVLRHASLGSGVITVQAGGTASGGNDGDIFLIY